MTAGHWTKFYQVIAEHQGLFESFDLIFTCQNNVVRFFVRSNQDVGVLSNSLEDILLRPVNDQAFTTPNASHTERQVRFVSGGNILDLREHYTLKKAKNLEQVVMTVRCLGRQKALVKALFYFKSGAGAWSISKKLFTFFPSNLLAINFTDNTRYIKQGVPKYLNIEKSLHMLVSDKTDALFEVDTFPYFSNNYYLNINSYDFDKHSFIIGGSGTGKSKLISLYIDRLSRASLHLNYRVVVIDPHASLDQDFRHIPDAKIMNFSNESAELFSEAATDISAATELTATLFKSLLGDQFNARLDRTLRFTLFVLMTAQNMSLDVLKRFLTDVDLRNKIIEHVEGYVPQNIIQFFGADYNEIRTKYYNDAVLPIVSLVDELQLQPALARGGDVSLARTIQENFLTVFSLNKVSMGEKTVKTVAGLLIQQIFLLAQARAISQKIILVVDEVSIVQNPALAAILSEARKFGLSVILTQQYFGQIDKDLRDSIFANVSNYYVFKVSEEDAAGLAGNLNIDLPKEIVVAEHEKGQKEIDIRIQLMTNLHPRECLIRLSADGKLNPCLKARTADLVTDHSVAHPHDLTHYPQEQIDLPAKFVEDTARPTPKSLEPTELTTPASGTSTSVTPERAAFIGHVSSQGAARPTFVAPSLSELLAHHSSSRMHITKRKDKA